MEAPPRFAPNIVQGKSYDLADPAAAPYFGQLLQLLLGAVVELNSASPGTGPDQSSRPAAGSLPAGPAILPGSRAGRLPPPLRHQRHPHPAGPASRPHQARHQKAGSTGSTTGCCCCAPTSTPCTTAATWASIPPTGCASAPACAPTSATATSSTPAQDKPSSYPNAAPTDPSREFLQWHLDEVFQT